jgi:hypothetical protein
MAKSKYDKQRAEAALAGARQYQELKAKMQQQVRPQ